MRVLVTGASGFVGHRLVRQLPAQGHRVSGTYLRESPEIDGVELFDVDILDAETLDRVVERVEPEAIVHLAGLSHVGQSWKRPAEYFQANVLGTENLLRSAAGIRVLAASSAEVYGTVPTSEQPISEHRRVAPQSPYALTKAAMERQVLAADGVVVRCFNLVGPGQAMTFALPTFARQLSAIRDGRQEPVLKVGNLSARRDFVHIDDAVEAVEILLQSGESGECYNIGSGIATSIGEALDRLIAVSGQSPAIEEDPARVRPVDLPLLQADSRKLESLGWTCKRDLDQALEDLWQAVLALDRGEPEVHFSTPV